MTENKFKLQRGALGASLVFVVALLEGILDGIFKVESKVYSYLLYSSIAFLLIYGHDFYVKRKYPEFNKKFKAKYEDERILGIRSKVGNLTLGFVYALSVLSVTYFEYIGFEEGKYVILGATFLSLVFYFIVYKFIDYKKM